MTDRSDLHADLVTEKLRETGAVPFRLNLDAFPRDYEISLELRDGDWRGGLRHSGDAAAVEMADIGAVWMRKKADFAFASDLGPQERAFAKAEAEHILFGLLHSLDGFWMNHPRAMRGAVWKGEQLQRAARMGFQVPPTCVTNRPEALADLARGADAGVIYKPLSSPTLSADEVETADRVATLLPTTLVSLEDQELLGALNELPGLFQHNVIKAYELRVTIIGDQAFVAKIHSQDDPRTALDSRDMSANVRYEATKLPADVERRCCEFVHSYGLTFGAIDLIVRPNGDYVFLENNPVGQFLYVEELVPELAMLDALSACLIRGASRSAEFRC